MAGYQYTIIIGNVGRAPEMRYTNTGIAVCDVSVAVNRTWTDPTTKEKREEVTWFRVSCWRGLAETVNQFVVQGMQIMVTGRIKASAYINKDGEAAAGLELTADNVTFLGRKSDNEQAASRFEDDGPSNFNNDELPF